MKEKKSIFTKETIISAAVGLAIGIGLTILIIFCVNSEGKIQLKYRSQTMATVNGKKITAQKVFDKVKPQYGLQYLIKEIDDSIFREMDTLTEKEKEEVKKQADEYISSAKLVGYTEQEFLERNGLASYDEFIDELMITKKSNKYILGYLEAKLEDGAVQKYYDEHKDEIAEYDSEHILVRITDTVTDEQALALANEIITKLNEGKTFDDIISEYGDKIYHEELGFQGKDSDLQQTYIDELVALQDGEYSKTPVKTTYGYHIVHKLSTATMEDLKDVIIEKLAESELFSKDENLGYKAFAELRKEKNVEIKDETLKKQYDNYLDQLYGTSTNT